MARRFSRRFPTDDCLSEKSFFSRLFCCFPLGGDLRLDAKRTLVFAIAVASCWCINVYVFREMIWSPLKYYRVQFQGHLEVFLIVMIDSLLTADLFFVLKNRAGFARLYRRILSTDEGFQPRRVPRQRVRCYDAIALLLLSCQILTMTSQRCFKLTPFYLCYTWAINGPYVLVHFLNGSFFTVLHLLAARFSLLRANVRRMPTCLLCEIHSSLCSITSSLANMFSATILMTTTTIFLITVSNLYFILVRKRTVSLDSWHMLWYLIPDCLWCLFWILELWILVSSCATAVKKVSLGVEVFLLLTEQWTMADHVDANPFFGYSLYLPRLLGAIPFDSAFQMKPSVLAYSCSVYSVLIGIAVYAIASLDKGYYRKSFDVVMDVCECLIVNCMAVSLWAGCARARAAVQKISFQWSALEVSFWGRISWNLFGLLTVCLETPLQMRAFSCENLGDFAYVLTLVVPYLYVNLANSVFHASCLLIEAQYSDLRRLLCTKHPYPIVLDGLVRRHALLCDQADSLGRAFSFSFLVLTAGIFVVSVCNIFFLIQRSNVLSQGQVLWEGQLMLVVWVLMWLSEQVMLARTCSRLVDQSKDFNTALFEMAMKDRTNQLARNEKLKLHIAMRREVNFSACGLFPIDYSLIHSMAAAATTYLVILVQFDQL